MGLQDGCSLGSGEEFPGEVDDEEEGRYIVDAVSVFGISTESSMALGMGYGEVCEGVRKAEQQQRLWNLQRLSISQFH